MGTTDRMPLPDAPGRESPVEGTDFFSSSPVCLFRMLPAGSPRWKGQTFFLPAPCSFLQAIHPAEAERHS